MHPSELGIQTSWANECNPGEPGNPDKLVKQIQPRQNPVNSDKLVEQIKLGKPDMVAYVHP